MDSKDDKEQTKTGRNHHRVRFYGTFETVYDVQTSPSQIANRVDWTEERDQQPKAKSPGSKLLLGILRAPESCQEVASYSNSDCIFRGSLSRSYSGR